MKTLSKINISKKNILRSDPKHDFELESGAWNLGVKIGTIWQAENLPKTNENLK